MTEQDRSKSDVVFEAANDNRGGGVQSGEDGNDALWSKSKLIPLVQLLARRAAAEIFCETANDNRDTEQKQPKE